MLFSKFEEVNRSVVKTLLSISDVIETFREEYPDAIVYLFGSCSRGQATGSSDVDVAIITSKSLGWRERSRFSVCYDTSKEVNFTYILRDDFDTLDLPLYSDIRRDGVLWEKLVTDLQL